MTYEYISPIGKIYITSNGEAITEIELFSHSGMLSDTADEVIKDTVRWLDCYFSGGVPDFMPRCEPSGSEFALSVLSECAKIKYGETRTYGDIANIVSKKSGKKPCARAVGGALNRNPIPILIPCHRVVGRNGRMVGFAYGVDVKSALLALESEKARNATSG